MTSAFPDAGTCHALTDRLAHVRWIGGGTGAGKSTLTQLLADRYDVTVYRGDRATTGHRCCAGPAKRSSSCPPLEFGKNALATRCAEPARARTNWGSGDPASAHAKRLARDALWDEEVR
ncbi:hypothetical protein ACFO3J_32350 [Streptomyces polygonati]|uniref:Dephospho-CoA kinase n=1 Tax=Streptomyces polygonati TaxID=1617087 RepID=A0ABV8HW05_9ACTN